MKKTTLLNSQLSSTIAKMGHTDMLAIGDCGLPISEHSERIDLALKKGIPDFITTLETVLSELCVEKAILARETKTQSPQFYNRILEIIGDNVELEYVSHEEFKKMTANCVATVRTGECTPYANIILCSGVTF